MARKTTKELQNELFELREKYERKIFDLEQIIRVSLSLNSGLELSQLIQSILFVFMGQLGVAQAGIFIRKDIARGDMVLHRTQVGLDLNFSGSKIIAQDHPLLPFLETHYQCFSYHELNELSPGLMKSTPLEVMCPHLIVPLRGKGKINGIIVLGEPLVGDYIDEERRQFALTIAALSGGVVHTAWLHEITTTDMMTGLRIRDFFLGTLGSEISDRSANSAGGLHLLMIDIDDFKHLNDTLGHVAGDQVIKWVAQVLRESIRLGDLGARYGGEEFGVIVKDPDPKTAKKIAERIRSKIAAHRGNFQGQNWSVTVSIGLATFDQTRDTSVESFIHRADTYLYSSKRNGKNQVTTISRVDL